MGERFYEKYLGHLGKYCKFPHSLRLTGFFITIPHIRRTGMLNKIIIIMLFMGISVNSFASSSDAWKKFRQEVITSCEKAAPELSGLDGYHIMPDPFGTESYGMAIIRGISGDMTPVFHICVYDKKTGKAEVGSEIREEHPKVSRIKGPRLDDIGGLNGINAATPFPIQDHERYLPGFTASLKKSTREDGDSHYMALFREGREAARIMGQNGKVSAIILTSRIIPPAVEGMIGNSLGFFIWGVDENTYRKYCIPGAEAWSGKIICRTRDAARSDTKHIRHVFSGEYDGPDGELPPLDVAKEFVIEATVWEK
jgi:hypothetical protein